MIIKGGSRSGPVQLAWHLQRRDTNENVNILEVQWPSPDLAETFRDWQTLSEGTHGTKGLYHCNIDPATDYAMTREQWDRCVEVLEKELGFEDLPRVVVMHEKHGREHIHVVWARTDIDTMTLRSDSMNYLAHERASKALELEFGHELVPGKHSKRDRKKQAEFPRSEMTHAEWQQAERTGVDPAERKDQITALKQASDGPKAFKAALEEQGYILAKGDKVPFVIIDEDGEVYNLTRQIQGMKVAELREFMKGIDREALPTAEQAAELQQQRQEERKRTEAEKSEAQAPELQPVEQAKSLSPEEIQAVEKAVAERQAREVANIRQRQEAEFEHTRTVLDEDLADRVGDLEARQKAETARFDRENKPPEGLDRMVDALQRWWNPEVAQQRDAERVRQRQEMEGRQKTERDDYEKMLRQTRDLELDNLGERHGQELRDHAHRTEEDLDRYIREQESARRLLEEIKERERQQEQELAREDGPERPPPTRAL